MAGAPQDLAFVARLLGDAAVPGPNPAAEARSRSKAWKRRRNDANIPANPEDEQSRKAVLDKYSRPNKKAPKQWFCEACSCTTAAREKDWDVHIKGIKHKRQLVSMMHTGQLGNTVLSLFEAEPGTVQQALWSKVCLPLIKASAYACCSANSAAA